MNHTSSLRFSLRYATPRQDAVAGEIHPSSLPAGGTWCSRMVKSIYM